MSAAVVLAAAAVLVVAALSGSLAPASGRPGVSPGSSPPPSGGASPSPTPVESGVAEGTPGTSGTPAPAPVTYQETAGQIVYRGTWARAALSTYSGGHVMWSKEARASASVAFTGIAITWTGPRGPTRGEARIYLDDRYVTTVDTYASHFDPSAVLYSTTFSTQQPHSLRIVVVGTAGRPTVAIDQIAVKVAVPTRPSGGPTPRPTAVPIPPPDSYPPDSALTFVATPPAARPAYLAPVLDPTWGTTVERVSNTVGVRQEYSRVSAWNSDQTRILLSFSYPGRLLNGSTFADLGSFEQISGATWSNVDPNKLYGVDAQGNGNRFYSQNASTGALTVLHTFTGYKYVTIGDGEGAIDDDDRTVALLGATSAGGQALIVYDIQADRIVATLDLPSRPNNAQISRKGNYVTVGWQVDGVGLHEGIERYTRDLTDPINLTPFSRHGDNALDANGNEIYVSNSPFVDSFRLSDGSRTRLLAGPTAFEYGHTSGRNIDRPGWVYLSVYDNSATVGRPGHDQVVAVKTDGSGIVEVFAFEHHTNTSFYGDQPQAVPSRDGTMVLFASEWGTTGAYAYVARR